MANTTVNKVVLGNETLLDLTADTVTPQTLYLGTTAHDASGAAIVGTLDSSSGSVYQDADGYLVVDDSESSAPQGNLSITSNGTYDVADYAGATVEVAGGLTNVVIGSFTTPSTTGVDTTFTIPYTGAGYPISLTVYVSGGIRNNTSGGNQEWYNLLQRYLIAEWHMVKCQTNTAPTWATSGSENECAVTVLYKDSTSNPDYYAATVLKDQTALGSSGQSANGTVAVGALRFKGNSTTVSYFVASSKYGFLADTTYDYVAVYSE